VTGGRLQAMLGVHTCHLMARELPIGRGEARAAPPARNGIHRRPNMTYALARAAPLCNNPLIIILHPINGTKVLCGTQGSGFGLE
jgi:hypothetical protein